MKVFFQTNDTSHFLFV